MVDDIPALRAVAGCIRRALIHGHAQHLRKVLRPPTSSVEMLTPILAFFREEFGVPRGRAAVLLGVVTFVFGLMHIMWLEHGFLDEWDYWAGPARLVWSCSR